MSKCEHIELATDDPGKARDFYAALFRWKVDAMPDGSGGDYLMFRTENGGGGIAGKMSPHQATAWMPYFTVASVNASLATAATLGGEVMMPFTPIGEMGAIAVLRDPTGASFGLWETSQKPAPAKQPAANAKPKAKAPAKAKPKAKPAAKAKPKAKAKGRK